MEPPLTVFGVGHVFIPGEDFRVARQKIRAAIEIGSLEERPIETLADLVPTRRHDPNLASVVGVHQLADLEVRAGRELRHSQTRSIVPLLPDVSASSVPAAAGTTGHATMRAILECTGHSCGQSACQLVCHFVPAHRCNHVRMADHLLEQSRKNQGPRHVQKRASLSFLYFTKTNC